MIQQVATPISEKRLLFRCTLIAIIIEGVVLTSFGWQTHWLVHPQKTTGLDDSKFLQTEMLQIPEKAELTTEKKDKMVVSHEAAISKLVGKGREKKANENPIQEENQVKEGLEPTMPPTHGPVAVYTPAPVLPSYLQNRDISSSVVIEFLISAQAAVTPRLLSSSGDEELDALALSTAKKWQFRPAENEHKPIDSKVRLRIVFEVK